MTAAIAISAQGPIRLTELLDHVARDCAHLGRVSLGDLIIRLDDRASVVLLALFALPFITPVPTVGLSMPFGLAAAVIGIGIVMGRQPPWPKRLLRLNLPAGLIGRLIRAGSRIWGMVDRLLRPRLTWVVMSTPWRWAHGIVAVVSGLLLALPLPIPFTNALPAITLLILATGMMQRDGLALIAAHVVFAVTMMFFIVLSWLGWEGIQSLATWWS